MKPNTKLENAAAAAVWLACVAGVVISLAQACGAAQRFAPQGLKPPAPGANVAPLERSGRE